MADLMYHSFFHQLMLAAIDLTNTTGDVLKFQLHTSTYTPDVDHSVIGDLTNEVAAAGNYSTGGVTVTANTMTPSDDDGNDRAAFDITEDMVWASSTITARYGVLIDTTATNALICSFDFGSDQTSTNGTFTVAFHSNGLWTIAGP
jgi:hypothetical protein